ncbi:unnamed protein product [marine sediment metagenome]|uniref:Uncharacterized protein n=1 Tax=marine sediment metagenome TaxID=412755 RepID=X1R5A2_9ZZZZ
MGADYKSGKLTIFDFEIPENLIQVAPNQDQWYPVMVIDRPLRCDSINFIVAVANETLEIELTISGGVPIVVAQAAVAGTNYALFRSGNPGVGPVPFVPEDTNAEHRDTPIFECHSLHVRIRKTTALGAGNLSCLVHWGRLEPTN